MYGPLYRSPEALQYLRPDYWSAFCIKYCKFIICIFLVSMNHCSRACGHFPKVSDYGASIKNSNEFGSALSAYSTSSGFNYGGGPILFPSHDQYFAAAL